MSRSATKYAALLLFMTATNASPQNATRTKDIPTIVREAGRAVVLVVASDKNGREITQGSGFLISRDGRIITNYHVIKRAKSAVIRLSNGAFYLIEGQLAADEEHDLVILQANGKDFSRVLLGDSDSVRVGEQVVAIGSPLSLESTVSNGIISAIREVKSPESTVLQITAPISQGSSGGPLFNMRGEVIGITSFQAIHGQNINFAIPINDAKALIAQISSDLFPLPEEREETKATPPENAAGTDSGVREKLWKNLKDGQTYKTRILRDRLYVEVVSEGLADLETCEFTRASSVGISWIGKCWERDRNNLQTKESTAFITALSNARIEGNKFLLIPAE